MRNVFERTLMPCLNNELQDAIGETSSKAWEQLIVISHQNEEMDGDTLREAVDRMHCLSASMPMLESLYTPFELLRLTLQQFFDLEWSERFWTKFLSDFVHLKPEVNKYVAKCVRNSLCQEDYVHWCRLLLNYFHDVACRCLCKRKQIVLWKVNAIAVFDATILPQNDPFQLFLTWTRLQGYKVSNRVNSINRLQKCNSANILDTIEKLRTCALAVSEKLCLSDSEEITLQSNIDFVGIKEEIKETIGSLATSLLLLAFCRDSWSGIYRENDFLKKAADCLIAVAIIPSIISYAIFFKELKVRQHLEQLGKLRRKWKASVESCDKLEDIIINIHWNIKPENVGDQFNQPAGHFPAIQVCLQNNVVREKNLQNRIYQADVSIGSDDLSDCVPRFYLECYRIVAPFLECQDVLPLSEVWWNKWRLHNASPAATIRYQIQALAHEPSTKFKGTVLSVDERPGDRMLICNLLQSLSRKNGRRTVTICAYHGGMQRVRSAIHQCLENGAWAIVDVSSTMPSNASILFELEEILQGKVLMNFGGRSHDDFHVFLLMSQNQQSCMKSLLAHVEQIAFRPSVFNASLVHNLHWNHASLSFRGIADNLVKLTVENSRSSKETKRLLPDSLTSFEGQLCFLTGLLKVIIVSVLPGVILAPVEYTATVLARELLMATSTLYSQDNGYFKPEECVDVSGFENSIKEIFWHVLSSLQYFTKLTSRFAIQKHIQQVANVTQSLLFNDGSKLHQWMNSAPSGVECVELSSGNRSKYSPKTLMKSTLDSYIRLFQEADEETLWNLCTKTDPYATYIDAPKTSDSQDIGTTIFTDSSMYLTSKTIGLTRLVWNDPAFPHLLETSLSSVLEARQLVIRALHHTQNMMGLWKNFACELKEQLEQYLKLFVQMRSDLESLFNITCQTKEFRFERRWMHLLAGKVPDTWLTPIGLHIAGHSHTSLTSFMSRINTCVAVLREQLAVGKLPKVLWMPFFPFPMKLLSNLLIDICVSKQQPCDAMCFEVVVLEQAVPSWLCVRQLSSKGRKPSTFASKKKDHQPRENVRCLPENSQPEVVCNGERNNLSHFVPDYALVRENTKIKGVRICPQTVSYPGEEYSHIPSCAVLESEIASGATLRSLLEKMNASSGSGSLDLSTLDLSCGILCYGIQLENSRWDCSNHTLQSADGTFDCPVLWMRPVSKTSYVPGDANKAILPCHTQIQQHRPSFPFADQTSRVKQFCQTYQCLMNWHDLNEGYLVLPSKEESEYNVTDPNGGWSWGNG